MKITGVVADGRKRAFIVRCGRRNFLFPYSQLDLRPSSRDPLTAVFRDAELGYLGFTYRLKSGREDTVLLDQVLEYNRDPEYLRQALLYQLTVSAKKLIQARAIPKRELARRLATSPAQVYRLLDQTDYQKTLDQMVRLLRVLGVEVEIKLKRAA